MQPPNLIDLLRETVERGWGPATPKVLHEAKRAMKVDTTPAEDKLELAKLVGILELRGPATVTIPRTEYLAMRDGLDSLQHRVASLLAEIGGLREKLHVALEAPERRRSPRDL